MILTVSEFIKELIQQHFSTDVLRDELHLVMSIRETLVCWAKWNLWYAVCSKQAHFKVWRCHKKTCTAPHRLSDAENRGRVKVCLPFYSFSKNQKRIYDPLFPLLGIRCNLSHTLASVWSQTVTSPSCYQICRPKIAERTFIHPVGSSSGCLNGSSALLQPLQDAFVWFY